MEVKPSLNNYQIKNFQPFRSPDGGGYNASLYESNKIIATLFDGGYGGAVDIHVEDTEAYKKLESYVTSLPPARYDDFELDMSVELFIGDLIAAYEFHKLVKKHSKKGTCFRKKDSPEGEFHIVSAVYSERVKTFLEEKYPGCEILRPA